MSKIHYSSFADVPASNDWKIVAEPRYSSYTSSLCTNLPALQEVEQKLDEDDLVLRLLLLDLRARRNVVCAPIMILPDEVLSLVFEFLCFSDPPAPPRNLRWCEREDRFERMMWGANVPNGSLGWYRVTHVCRRWRACALRQSELWAEHIGLLPYALETVLARSGDHRPLTIQLKKAGQTHKNYDMPVTWKTLALFHADGSHAFEFSRVRSIDVLCTDSWDDLEKPSAEFISYKLSGVKEVRLRGITGCLHCSEYNEPGPATLEEWHKSHPPLLTPNLRDLYLENTFVPFKANNLTRLSIRRTCYENGEAFTYSHCKIPPSVLLETLRQTQYSLEFLDLAHHITYQPGTRFGDPLDFSSMRKLCLCDSAESLAAFLSIIVIPRTTQLSVTLTLQKANKIPVQGVSVLRTAIGRVEGCDLPKGLALRSSQGKVYGEDIHTFALYPNTDWEEIADTESDAPFQSTTPPITLGITSCPSRSASKPPRRGRVIKTLAEVLDLSQIETLSLDLHKWDDSTIRTTLDYFTSLRVLHIHNPIPLDRTLAQGLPSFAYLRPPSNDHHNAARSPAPTPPPFSLFWISQDMPPNPAVNDAELACFTCVGFSRAAEEIREAGLQWDTPVQKLRVDCVSSWSNGAIEGEAFFKKSIQHLVPNIEWRRRVR
ncbi:hypothetical protein PENSPDRAFT_648026 [Peniophora sp. CONT]|nr:hypothetical protein PENSPDRAFT_648026 [Peniophora sp. CONT]